MDLNVNDLSGHPEVEHALNSAIELQTQFRDSIEQLTQAFHAYEGAPDLGPSYMRHARTALLDLSRNNLNILDYLKKHHQNLTHAVGLENQNTDQLNLERANFMLGINQFQMQLKLVQVLISLFLHNLRAQDKLRKELQEQAQKLHELQYQLAQKQVSKSPENKKTRLEDQAHTARTAPFFPHPKPHYKG